MSGRGQRKGNNPLLPLFRAPLGERLVRSVQVSKENGWWDSSPDDAIFPVIIRNPEHPIPVFNVEWCRYKNLRFQQVKHAHCPSTLSTSEQGKHFTRDKNVKLYIRLIGGVSRTNTTLAVVNPTLAPELADIVVNSLVPDGPLSGSLANRQARVS